MLLVIVVCLLIDLCFLKEVFDFLWLLSKVFLKFACSTVNRGLSQTDLALASTPGTSQPGGSDLITAAL